MITKERLQELIEQESGCYVLNDYITGYIHLKPKYEPETYENGLEDYILYIYCNDKKEYKEEIFSEQLFETEEEAEWHKEFDCIERTERLKLPTWEEFNEMSSFIFENKNGIELEMAIWICDRCSQMSTIKITDYNDWNIRLFELPLTKENYILACRKCKELFLGEKG